MMKNITIWKDNNIQTDIGVNARLYAPFNGKIISNPVLELHKEVSHGFDENSMIDNFVFANQNDILKLQAQDIVLQGEIDNNFVTLTTLINGVKVNLQGQITNNFVTLVGMINNTQITLEGEIVNESITLTGLINGVEQTLNGKIANNQILIEGEIQSVISTLPEYKTGTWAPTIVGVIPQPSFGKYLKIGNFNFLTCKLNLNPAELTGLPDGAFIIQGFPNPTSDIYAGFIMDYNFDNNNPRNITGCITGTFHSFSTNDQETGIALTYNNNQNIANISDVISAGDLTTIGLSISYLT